MNRVLRNIVRGAFFQAAKRPLSPTTEIAIFDHRTMQSPQLQAIIDGLPLQWTHFGDDVFGCRYRRSLELHEDFFVCLMIFYRRKLFLGMTVPDGFREKYAPRGEFSN